MTYAIAGVTGNTGKAAAEALLAQGKKIRVIVREASKGEPWKAKGADVAIADIGDSQQMARALEGVEGAWLLVPPRLAPGFRDYQKRTVDALVTALTLSKIPQVAFLSSVGAQHPSGTGPITGLHLAEQAFAPISTTRFSFLRAAYFMENLGGSLGMLEQGLLPSFTPSGFAFDMVATVDIGKLAAQLLVEGTSKTQWVELGGPPVSMKDVAAALSSILGKPIKVHEAPVEAMVPTLTGFGMPQEMAELYREMTEGLLQGRVAFEGGHRRISGATPVETVLRGILSKAR